MISLLRNRLLWPVSIGHFTIDLYTNILPIALPFLMESLNLSFAAAGLIITLYQLTSSLSQPLFGYIADRFGSRLLAPLGIAWAAVLMALIGFAPDYSTLLVIVFLGGFGSGCFHPQGAMNASWVGGERSRATAVSIFMLGGNMGFASGPVVAATLLGWMGLRGTVLMAIPTLTIAYWLHRAMVALDQHRQVVEATREQKAPVKMAAVGLVSLILIIMMRSWTLAGVTAFLPLLYKGLGHSVEEASQTMFIMLLSVAIGGLLGGWLSDILGRKSVTFVSLLLLAPATYLFVGALPPWSLVAAIPVGLFMGATYGITLVMAQEMLPKNMGVASGLVLGLAFVTGGIGVSITGLAADSVGLYQALAVTSLMPLVSALLCINLRPSPAGHTKAPAL
ncbi:MAG: MFS transporter [Chloroflexi bacterium]|nr:MFS transporter [Chloroflexota bacterium]